MVRFLRMLLLMSAALFVISCGGGGAGGAVPAAQSNGVPPQADATKSAILNHGPQYVAQALPANFVPSAMMPNGAVPGSFGRDAAVFRDGRIENLGTFGSEFAVATSANSRGTAVGFSTAGMLFTPDVPGRALLFARGTVRELRGLSGTDFNDARAIDDAGHIYGGSGSRSNDSGPRTLQFVRFTEGGSATAVAPAFFFNDENADSAIAINHAGRFTATRAGDGTATFPNRAMVGRGLTVSQLITHDESTAAGLNDRGDVIGTFTPLLPTGQTVGFHFDQFGMRVLPFFPDGINNRGTIDGTDANGNVVIERRGQTFRLNDVLQRPLAVSAVLRGLSNRGAFVVLAGNTYYIIKPVGDANS